MPSSATTASFERPCIGCVLGLDLYETPPEHSTILRTRRLIDMKTHRAVFTWILPVLATADLIRGKTIGIDPTTLTPVLT